MRASRSKDKSISQSLTRAIIPNGLSKHALPTIRHTISTSLIKDPLSLNKINLGPVQSELQEISSYRRSSKDLSAQKWGSTQLQNSLNHYSLGRKAESQSNVAKTLYLVSKFNREVLEGHLALQKRKQPSRQDKTEIPMGRSKAAHLTFMKKTETPEQVYFKEKKNIKFENIGKSLTPNLGNAAGSMVKYSDQKVGPIKGFAVSSQMGDTYAPNSVRVSIALNLLKTPVKNREISFIGLFQGKGGHGKAQYMRQNFHQALSEDGLIIYNFEKAIARALDKFQKYFNFDPMFNRDYSTVQFIICVVSSSSLYFVRYGNPNATISSAHAHYIKSFSAPERSQPEMEGKKWLQGRYRISIKKFDMNNNFDFILLGSEGMYETLNNEGQIGRQFWKECFEGHRQAGSEISKQTESKIIIKLENPQQGVSAILAKASEKICWKAVRSDKMGRCVSLVAIAFGNVENCFVMEENQGTDGESGLKLPYVGLRKDKVKQQEDVEDVKQEAVDGEESQAL